MFKLYFCFLSILLSLNAFSQTCVSEAFNSSSEWTQIGSTVTIEDGLLKFKNTPGGSDTRVYRTVPSFDLWKLEFEFNAINHSSEGAAQVIMAYTAGNEQTEDSEDQRARVLYLSKPTGTPAKFYIDANNSTQTDGISATLGTKYYLTYERSCATELKLSVFSNPERTLHVAGSPISSTITNSLSGLNTLQSGNSVLGQGRNLTAEIDNINLCGTETSCFALVNRVNTWIQVGTGVTHSQGKITFNNAVGDGTDRRIFANVQTADFWNMSFKFTPTDYNNLGPAHILLAYSKGIIHSETPGNVQVRVIYLSNPTESTPKLYMDATSTSGLDAGVEAPKGATYYVQLEKFCGNQIRMSVFSNPEMTTHLPGSPVVKTVTADISGLNTLQSGNSMIIGNPRVLTAEIDNMNYCGTNVITSLTSKFSESIQTENFNQLDIYDFQGKEILEMPIINGNWNGSIAGLEPGFYIVNLSDGKKRKSFKIAVTK